MSGLGTKSSGEGAEGILLGIVITGEEGIRGVKIAARLQG
jgi:hypothetical protein